MPYRPEIFDFKIDKITQEHIAERPLNVYMHVETQDGPVEGPSIATDEVGGIGLIAWSHEFWQPSQLERDGSSGVSVSDALHGDLTVIKQIDTTTPTLLKQCWTGTTIPKIELHCRRSDSNPYLYIIMENIIITEYTFFDIPSFKDSLERLKFNYMTIEYRYTATDQSAALGGQDVIKYDRALEATS